MSVAIEFDYKIIDLYIFKNEICYIILQYQLNK